MIPSFYLNQNFSNTVTNVDLGRKWVKAAVCVLRCQEESDTLLYSPSSFELEEIQAYWQITLRYNYCDISIGYT